MFSHSTKGESHVLIDIGQSSIAGAYTWSPPAAPPMVAWAKRVPIVSREGETPEIAMQRALELMGNALTTEGAPALARVAGNARIEQVVVAIDAPWQQTSVRVEQIAEAEPFTFSKRVLAEALAKAAAESGQATAEGQEIEEHAIDIRLNGYQTRNPYGKRARRATFVILISSITTVLKEAVGATLKKYLHTADALYISGPSLRFQVLHSAFPHERDVLILDAIGTSIALSLVRQGILVAVAEPQAGQAPLEAVRAALGEFAKAYPLPRTILLVTDEVDPPLTKAQLEGADLGALWLTERPPTILALTRAQLPNILNGPEALPDIRLALMAQYPSS